MWLPTGPGIGTTAARRRPERVVGAERKRLGREPSAISRRASAPSHRPSSSTTLLSAPTPRRGRAGAAASSLEHRDGQTRAKSCDSGTEPSDTCDPVADHIAPFAARHATRACSSRVLTSGAKHHGDDIAPEVRDRMLVTDIEGLVRSGRTERISTTLPEMQQPVDQEELRQARSRSVRHAPAAEVWRARSSIRRGGRSRPGVGCRGRRGCRPRARCPGRCRESPAVSAERDLSERVRAARAVDVGDESPTPRSAPVLREQRQRSPRRRFVPRSGAIQDVCSFASRMALRMYSLARSRGRGNAPTRVSKTNQAIDASTSSSRHGADGGHHPGSSGSTGRVSPRAPQGEPNVLASLRVVGRRRHHAAGRGRRAGASPRESRPVTSTDDRGRSRPRWPRAADPTSSGRRPRRPSRRRSP